MIERKSELFGETRPTRSPPTHNHLSIHPAPTPPTHPPTPPSPLAVHHPALSPFRKGVSHELRSDSSSSKKKRKKRWGPCTVKKIINLDNLNGVSSSFPHSPTLFLPASSAPSWLRGSGVGSCHTNDCTGFCAAALTLKVFFCTSHCFKIDFRGHILHLHAGSVRAVITLLNVKLP